MAWISLSGGAVTEFDEIGPGVYGKLPFQSEFLTLRLGRDFVSAWDLWLQQAMVGSRHELGEKWLSKYVVAPVWRFLLTPGIAGDGSWVGLMMPSKDAVDRCFPLTLACPVPAGILPFKMLAETRAWFDKAETLMLSWLRDTVDAAAVRRSCVQLGGPLTLETAKEHATQESVPESGDAWCLPLDMGDDGMVSALYPLVNRCLCDRFYAYSVWQFPGNEDTPGALLVCQGLPPAESFASILLGTWHSGFLGAMPTAR